MEKKYRAPLRDGFCNLYEEVAHTINTACEVSQLIFEDKPPDDCEECPYWGEEESHEK